MPNDLTTRSGSTELALDQDFASQLLSGLMQSRTVIQAGGSGKPFLRLARDGEWVYGQGDDPVEEGSSWAINVKTLAWGSVCWTNYPAGQKNKRLGIVTVPMTQDKPPTPAPIEGFPFADFVTFDLLCLDGEDAGTEVTYGANSHGGLKAFTKLRDAIIMQLQKDIRYPCPVVALETEDYKHNSYGKIFNPIFRITGWADLRGNLPEASESGPAKQPLASPASVAAAAEPVRKRKAAGGATGADITAATEAAEKAARQAAYAQAREEQAKADMAAAGGDDDAAAAYAEFLAVRKAKLDAAAINGPAPVSTQRAHTSAPAEPAPHTGQRRRHRPAG